MTSVHLHQSPVHQYNNKVHYCLCYNPMLAVILLTFNSMAIKCEEAVFLMLMVALSKVECHDSKQASWDSCWYHFWRSGVSWPHASSTSPCWGKWICSHDSSLCRRSLGPSWSAIRHGLWSLASYSTWFQLIQPRFFHSASIVLLHVIFGLPCSRLKQLGSGYLFHSSKHRRSISIVWPSPFLVEFMAGDGVWPEYAKDSS